MEYEKVIESYVGRKVDFTSEVIMEDAGDGVVKITKWNVAGKSKPTDAQMTTTWNAQKVSVKKTIAKEKAYGKHAEIYEHKALQNYLDNDADYKKEVSDIDKMTEAQLDAYLQG